MYGQARCHGWITVKSWSNKKYSKESADFSYVESAKPEDIGPFAAIISIWAVHGHHTTGKINLKLKCN